MFNVAPADTRASLIARAASVLDANALQEAVAALAGGTKTDCEGAARFEAALRATGGEAICAALKAAFATQKGEPRKSLMTAAVKRRCRGAA